MNYKNDHNISEIKHNESSRRAETFQSWPGQFSMRKSESDVLFNFFKFEKEYVGLEIGCGIGFQSAMIADKCRKLIATDLYYADRFSHSLGINKARELLAVSKIDNVELVSCSAEKLPFKDSYFDFVFSSSALEHVINKDLALKEMSRVLKKGGYVIAIVPNFMLSVYAFLYTPLYFLKRSIMTIFNSVTSDVGLYSSSIKNFRRNRPCFPLPEPHGSYKSIFHEMFECFPFRWHSLFRKSGLKTLVSRTTCFLPWSLIEVFSTKLGAELYNATKWAHVKLNMPISASYLFCIIARKD